MSSKGRIPKKKKLYRFLTSKEFKKRYQNLEKRRHQRGHPPEKNTIRRIVDSTKDPIDPIMHKGVYSIPCSCGKVYIGETGRSMKVSFKEHSADIKLNIIKKSTLAMHSFKTNHHIYLENGNIITRVDHYERRKVMEALEIELHPNNLN